MSHTVKHEYQFKRGKEKALQEANPFLRYGEPIAVYTADGKMRLKIGDGVNNYNDLAFIGGEGSISEAYVLNYNSRLDFPNEGNAAILYKAESEAKLYQWNSELHNYQLLDVDDVNLTVEDIEFISGGIADTLIM